MKKIINGKVYNTDTATLVNEWSNNLSYRDFHWREEKLYRKKTGEYFLYGEGGPASKYAESCGQNQWSSGDSIIPLSFKSAREWAESHLDADEYEAEFGEIAEDDSTVTLSLSVPADVAAKARRAAQEAEVSLSAYIASLIK